MKAQRSGSGQRSGQAMQKWLYQLHLWMGIALGLYILVMSLTGSAIVARRELLPILAPETVTVVGERLTGEQLEQALRTAYPKYQILDLYADQRSTRGFSYGRPSDPLLAAPYQVTLDRSGKVSIRLFDPFTGEDLGDIYPWTVTAFLWLVDLHAELQAGQVGRTINGFAGLAAIILILSGLVIWSMKGRRYLYLRRNGGWRSQFRQLHGSIGFWLFALLLLWAVSGVYLAFPTQFFNALDLLFPTQEDYNYRVDAMTSWLASMHFGRFGGMGVRWTWIILGLAPAVLFITGFILWWQSSVKPWRRRQTRAEVQPAGSKID